jgi:ribulose-phosphate 3-epimerase
MKTKISPAMLYADLRDLKSPLSAFELNGIDLLHVDVSDGSLSPCIAGGIELCDTLRAHTSIPLDLHLALQRPEDILPSLHLKKGDQVSIYSDSTSHLYRVLCDIKKSGAKVYLALGLTTPLSVLEEVLDYVDGVFVSLSEIGSASSKIPSGAISKIERIRALMNAKGHSSKEIEVQGYMSFENAAKMRKAGATIFVGDSLSVFSKDQTLAGGIVRLRNAVQ